MRDAAPRARERSAAASASGLSGPSNARRRAAARRPTRWPPPRTTRSFGRRGTRVDTTIEPATPRPETAGQHGSWCPREPWRGAPRSAGRHHDCVNTARGAGEPRCERTAWGSRVEPAAIQASRNPRPADPRAADPRPANPRPANPRPALHVRPSHRARSSTSTSVVVNEPEAASATARDHGIRRGCHERSEPSDSLDPRRAARIPGASLSTLDPRCPPSAWARGSSPRAGSATAAWRVCSPRSTASSGVRSR